MRADDVPAFCADWADAQQGPIRLSREQGVGDVHTVLVDGRVVLEDRWATGVDEAGILDTAQRGTELLRDRLGPHDRLDTPETFWGHTRAIDQVRH